MRYRAAWEPGTARERLDLLLVRLQVGLPLPERGTPWLWPEGDVVWSAPETEPSWLPPR